jgi:nucleotide-binding universal stress UspA family protein
MAAARLVVGVDGSDGADAAVQWCARHAPGLAAAVTVVAVIEPAVWLAPPTAAIAEAAERVEEGEREEVQAKLDADWCKPLRDAGVPYETRTLRGEPAGVLVEVAVQLDADLLVVGRRGRGGIVEMLVGGVPYKLAHRAELPVIIVPAPKQNAEG